METSNFKIRVIQSRRYSGVGGFHGTPATMNYSEVTHKKTGKMLFLWLPKLHKDIDSMLLKNYNW